MKVLKKGTERDDLCKKFTCMECGALLEVHPGDIKSFTDSDGDTCYWFVCPECTHRTHTRRWWVETPHHF